MPSSLDYPTKLSQALNDLRKQTQLCDIVINVGGRAFHAHKAVLAACSSYFLAMFTSGFKESTASEISIDGKATIFEILLQFAYTGDLKITSKMAYDVLEMACYMQFTDVYPTCCDLIQNKYTNTSDKISMGDVFKISQLAKNHDCLKQLVEESLKYMEENVQELKGTGEFLQNANVDFLEEFLSREDLSSAEEEKQVLEMVVSWLKYDWESRRTHSLCLLEKVRLGLVSAETLKELLDVEILEIPECQQLLDHVLQLQSSTKSVNKLSQKHPKLFATRSTITVPISFYLDDYNSDIYGKTIYKHRFQFYNAQDKCWKHLNQFHRLSCSSSLIVVKGKLYAAGGLHESEETDTDYSNSDSTWDSDESKEDRYRYHAECQRNFSRYSPTKNKWCRLPKMHKARQKFTLVFLDGFIYAIAGSNDNSFMRDVERYDMAKKEWQVLPSLPEGYHWVSAVVFRGKILVYGVSSKRTRNPLTFDSHNYMLQVFHPTTRTWQMALTEQREEATSQRTCSNNEPALIIHKDVCYRILYHTPKDSTGQQPWYWFKITQPSVNVLEFESQSDDAVTVAVGEEINQDFIPTNRMHAFRINDEVFVCHKGFAYKTDVEIGPDQSVDVNLHEWERFTDINTQSNITWFTFDRKRLGY